MNKRCEIFQRWFSPYIDAQLPEKEKRLLENHLDKCELCREDLDDLRKMLNQLGSQPPPESPDSTADVRLKLEAQSPSEPAWKRRLRGWTPVHSAALAAVGLIVVAAVALPSFLRVRSRSDESEKKPVPSAALSKDEIRPWGEPRRGRAASDENASTPADEPSDDAFYREKPLAPPSANPGISELMGQATQSYENVWRQTHSGTAVGGSADDSEESSSLAQKPAAARSMVLSRPLRFALRAKNTDETVACIQSWAVEQGGSWVLLSSRLVTDEVDSRGVASLGERCKTKLDPYTPEARALIDPQRPKPAKGERVSVEFTLP